MAYNRVVVPLDGSALAESAVPLAVALAEGLEARVTFCTVLPSSHETHSQASGHGGSSVNWNLSPEGYLDHVRQKLPLGDGRVELEILEGDPSSKIVEFIRQKPAQLVVMATHGRSGVVRAILGSVTDRVVHASPAPVLAVRATNAPRSMWQARTIERVVVPLDGSELAEAALTHGQALAEAFHAKLSLFRVADDAAGEVGTVTAASYLEGIASRFPDPSHDLELELRTGHAPDEIVRFSIEQPHSVVVMSTHGASGFERMRRGSVTDAVVRGAATPTLVVPPVPSLLGPAIH